MYLLCLFSAPTPDPEARLTECEHPAAANTADEPGQKAGTGHHLYTMSSAMVAPTWQSALAILTRSPPVYCLSGVWRYG